MSGPCIWLAASWLNTQLSPRKKSGDAIGDAKNLGVLESPKAQNGGGREVDGDAPRNGVVDYFLVAGKSSETLLSQSVSQLRPRAERNHSYMRPVSTRVG